MKKYTSVTDYMADLPKEVKVAVKKLRANIKKALPKAVEVIGYGMPGFKQDGKYVVFFAAWKSHIALYPGTSSAKANIPELLKYRAGKGTFQFPLNKPLPLAAIAKFAKLRAKQNLE